MPEKKPAERFKFTMAALEKFVGQHQGERLVIHDLEVPGLIGELREGGAMSFYLYRRIDGRPSRYRIGRFPLVTVESARRQARIKIGEIADGKNPIEERRQSRRSFVLSAIWEHRLQYLKAHCQPNTVKEDTYYWDCQFAAFRNRQLKTITKKEMIDWHAKIGEVNGHFYANRCLSLMATLFNMAADDLDYAGANPCRKIKRFPEPKRTRFLLPEELEPFFTALAQEASQQNQDFFVVTLFVAARRGNVQAMRWEEVNLPSATWTIPRTKNGESQTVPIPAPALEVLKRRQKSAGNNPWVFPSELNPSGHMHSPKNAWERLRKRSGIKNLRMHDLRRTLASWQAATGASLPIIGKTLGHKSSSATEIYARLHLGPVKTAMDVAAAAILKAGNVKTKRTKKK
jgi:integrase